MRILSTTTASKRFDVLYVVRRRRSHGMMLSPATCVWFIPRWRRMASEDDAAIE
jgi:hypothetical protein